VTFTFDLLTLKVMPESHVTWATSVLILVFLGLSVLDLGPMYATDRDVRQHHRFMPTPIRGGGITSCARGDKTQYMPPPAVRRTLRPSCSPSLTPAAPSAPCFQ